MAVQLLRGVGEEELFELMILHRIRRSGSYSDNFSYSGDTGGPLQKVEDVLGIDL